MKIFFVFLATTLLSSYHLAAYSSIPEYSSSTPNVYLNVKIVRDNPESVQGPEEFNESVESSPILETQGLLLTYKGKLKLDDDGTGSTHGDPSHKSTTSWKVNGRSLNSDYDSFVVAPLWLLAKGVKAGDRADVIAYFESDLYQNGVLIKSTPYTKAIQSIVGDFGPSSNDVGEISIKAALDLGCSFRDVQGIGPIPTFNGSDADSYVTVIYYPSGTPWQ